MQTLSASTANVKKLSMYANVALNLENHTLLKSGIIKNGKTFNLYSVAIQAQTEKKANEVASEIFSDFICFEKLGKVPQSRLSVFNCEYLIQV